MSKKSKRDYPTIIFAEPKFTIERPSHIVIQHSDRSLCTQNLRVELEDIPELVASILEAAK